MIWAGGRTKRAGVGICWEKGFWNAEWASGDGFRISYSEELGCMGLLSGNDIPCSRLGTQSDLRDSE